MEFIICWIYMWDVGKVRSPSAYTGIMFQVPLSRAGIRTARFVCDLKTCWWNMFKSIKLAITFCLPLLCFGFCFLWERRCSFGPLRWLPGILNGFLFLLTFLEAQGSKPKFFYLVRSISITSAMRCTVTTLPI